VIAVSSDSYFIKPVKPDAFVLAVPDSRITLEPARD